jgi:predicted Zn-dependent protease with MMP-like domain/Tfp pilus assembly protein PilF
MNKPEDPASMDAHAAHLDRGWDLLKKNDFTGARVSAQAALKVDPESAEALTLLGAIAGAEGDEEEAIDLYRRAMALDPEYVAPMLYAAELLLYPEEDYDEALQLTEEAIDLAEEEDDVLDALLLKAEILIAMGDREDEAKAVLTELPPTRFPEPSFHLRAGRSFLDLHLVDQAEEHYRQAIAADAADAEAYHGLGMVYEEREDLRAMAKAWLKVRELDEGETAPPWAVTQEEFERIAEAALEELPERIRKLLENVPIMAAEYPSIEIIAEGNDPRMMGFFSGIPYPEKQTVAGSSPHLDCVFLYKRNIERIARNREEVAREIRTTLLHETGHFFGLSEEELEEMGLG